MYGTIIIDPAQGNRIRADRDYVVQLSEWTDEDPLDVFATLKKMSDYYNFIQPTAGDFFRDVSELGLGKALRKRRMWNRMRMNPTDLADISGYTYTYLMNGTAPAGNWTALFRPGPWVAWAACTLRRAAPAPCRCATHAPSTAPALTCAWTRPAPVSTTPASACATTAAAC